MASSKQGNYSCFIAFCRKRAQTPSLENCVRPPLVACLFLSRVGRTGRSRGSGQYDVSQRWGSLVLLACSRICSPAAGDEARVESYVCSFINKQPENSIPFGSKQANGWSTNLHLTLHNATLFARVSCVKDAGLCIVVCNKHKSMKLCEVHLKLTNHICNISAGWKCFHASWERQGWQPFSEWNVSTRSDVPPSYGIDITSA